MATVERQFVDEYADGTVEVGNLDAQAVTNSDHVKTIAPVFYTPGTVGNDNKITRQTPVTIQGALDAKAAKAGLSSGATKCKITYNADGIVTGGADLTASDIKDGTLPVSRGGTGISTTTTVNSVLIGNSSNAASNLQTVATASGAFYATSANGKPTFGTLPIAQGGTGATSRKDALKNLTNQSVGTSATHFVTLYDSRNNGGYTTVDDARTVLGLNTSSDVVVTYAAESSRTHKYWKFASTTFNFTTGYVFGEWDVLLQTYDSAVNDLPFTLIFAAHKTSSKKAGPIYASIVNVPSGETDAALVRASFKYTITQGTGTGQVIDLWCALNIDQASSLAFKEVRAGKSPENGGPASSSKDAWTYYPNDGTQTPSDTEPSTGLNDLFTAMPSKYATYASKIGTPNNTNGTSTSQLGTTTQPVYVNSSGEITECTAYDNATVGTAKAYDSSFSGTNSINSALEAKANSNAVVAIADATVNRSSSTEWFDVATYTYSNTSSFVWNGTWLATINATNSSGVNLGGTTFFIRFAGRFADTTTAPSATSFSSSPIDESLKSLIDGIKFKLTFTVVDGNTVATLYYSPQAAYRLLTLKAIEDTIGIPNKTKGRWTYKSFSSDDAGSSTEPTGNSAKVMDWVYAISSSSIPAATSSAIGGIKIGYSGSGSNYAVKLASQKAYVTVPWTDTKQTVASSTNQMYLTGVANVDGTAQTGMANTKIYATDGQLRATKFDVNGGCTLQYNSTTNALDFVFPS